MSFQMLLTFLFCSVLGCAVGQNKDNLLEDEIYVYFNFDHVKTNVSEFKAMKNNMISAYIPTRDTAQNGYFTVRFYVDSTGNTYNYHTLSVDNQFKTKTFAQNVSEPLTQIVKSIKGWLPMSYGNKRRVYLMFFTFKLQHGAIVDILP